MRFYGREEEIAALRKAREIAQKYARFTVLTGRRRVGKTQLVRKALEDGAMPYVHLVITRKPEKVQCRALQETIEKELHLPFLGTAERFVQLFEALMKASLEQAFTLVLDEFQEFDHVDSGIFGEVAGIWDQYHASSHVNLVVCGSVNRLMNKIFFDDSQPLYGRSTGTLKLDPFKVSVLKEILKDFSPDYKPEDLLDLWTITGGVARYVELLMENGATNRAAMLDVIFGRITSYIDEGKAVLSEEFGKDYGTYFSILAAIASGSTTTSEIGNEIGIDLGGYITRLEGQYGIIAKKQPVYEHTTNKNCHFQIEDCFFRFWFRFIYRYQEWIELRRFDELKIIAARDLDTFSGYALERYFWWKFVEDTSYTKMGAWWDRKGENEIDLVCEDDFENKLDFYEIKREASRIDLAALQLKTAAFFNKNPQLKDRQMRCLGLSLADM